MKTQFIYIASALSIAAAIVVATIPIGHADAESKNPQQKASQLQNNVPSSITPPPDSATKEKLTDGSFVEKAALTSLSNAELSKLALQKSQNKKLKKFATKVMDGSNKTIDNLKQIASSFKLDVPQQLTSDQRQLLQQMQQLNGREFDLAYANVMVKAQDSTVGLFDNAAGEPSLNAELRVFASKELPTLRQNQKLVHSLIQTTPSSAAAQLRRDSNAAKG